MNDEARAEYERLALKRRGLLREAAELARRMALLKATQGAEETQEVGRSAA